MWRLLLSGLFCLPALVILFHQRSHDPVPGSDAINTPSANVVASNTSTLTVHLSLSQVELPTEPALPDPDMRNVTGPSVTIPLQNVLSQMSTVASPIAATKPRLMADGPTSMHLRGPRGLSHHAAASDVA